jgi:hypothetical protein
MGMDEKSLRKLIRETLEQLDESRMSTSTFGLMSQVSRNIPGLERLDIKTMSDGMAGLFRYKDGNAYEVQIRPASLIKDKDMWGNLLKKKEEHPLKPYYRMLNKNSE